MSIVKLASYELAQTQLPMFNTETLGTSQSPDQANCNVERNNVSSQNSDAKTNPQTIGQNAWRQRIKNIKRKTN